jgi:hypothetical protein
MYRRLIPKDGLSIYPDIWYLDVFDIPKEKKERTIKFFHEEDLVYKGLAGHRNLIDRGSKLGREFCIYVMKDGKDVCNIVLKEYLDNPDGYGLGDFFIGKQVWPDFRGTIYSRYASGDLIHMVFMSGLARRLYHYSVALPNSQGNYWDRIDRSMPCIGHIFKTDGPGVQKYISIKREIPTSWKDYILIEFDGDIYKKMDLEEYFMSIPGRDAETVKKWLVEMQEAAEKVREIING